MKINGDNILTAIWVTCTFAFYGFVIVTAVF